MKPRHAYFARTHARITPRDISPLMYRFNREPFGEVPGIDPVVNKLSYLVQRGHQMFYDLPRDRLLFRAGAGRRVCDLTRAARIAEVGPPGAGAVRFCCRRRFPAAL